VIANYQHHRHTSRVKRQQVLAEERREREANVANSNAAAQSDTEQQPATPVDASDEFAIPQPNGEEETRPSATITPIGRAAGEGKI
jgi:hypothetical protein